MARTLAPGGAIYFITDVEDLFRFALPNLRACGLEERAELPPRPVRTTFENKATQSGRTLHSVALVKPIASASSQRRSA
jgi:tRNA G46 methylase TrmB